MAYGHSLCHYRTGIEHDRTITKTSGLKQIINWRFISLVPSDTPAMVESLGYTDRTLKEDGIHFTELDYLEVAREINLHLDRYRL